MAPSLPVLRPDSHSIEEVTERILTYIERSRRKWTSAQRNAFVYLKRFITSDDAYQRLETELLQRRNNALGSKVIAKIGDLFLLEGLGGVGFDSYNDPTKAAKDNTVAETSNGKKGGEAITFNAGHPHLCVQSVAARRKELLSKLLHEAIHVVFRRYLSPQTFKQSPTGHHAGFNLVAEATERQASILFKTDLDLVRDQSFIEECVGLKGVDMTRDQLETCFGKQFTHDATSNLLYDDDPGNESVWTLDTGTWEQLELH